tara:strand:- start:4784 stop:5428 length:645 start_codon:yes stop_codon:yes gene_type:complete
MLVKIYIFVVITYIKQIMKKIFLSTLLASFTFLSIAANPHIVYTKVSTESSVVKWTGSKIASSHEGTVKIQDGVLDINHGTLVGGNFTIDMNSIACTDIESAKKNAYFVSHLKNEDFFNVESFPTASIKITNVARGQGSFYKVVADLTIKGITHSISFAADVKIAGKKYTADAKIKIDRTKWDIVYKSGSIFKDLGDKIILDEIEFDISLISAN